MSVDTLAFARERKAAEQAATPLTRADLAALRTEMIGRLDLLELRIDTKIERLKGFAIMWSTAVGIALAAFVIAVIKL